MLANKVASVVWLTVGADPVLISCASGAFSVLLQRPAFLLIFRRLQASLFESQLPLRLHGFSVAALLFAFLLLETSTTSSFAFAF